MKRFEKRKLRPLWNGAACRIDLDADDRALLKLQSTLASYSGHLRHGAAWRAWEEIWRGHQWLDALLIAGDAHRPWRVRTRWPGRSLAGPRPSTGLRTGFSRQYARLTCHAGDRALVFCQVGRFVEFYGPQRVFAARVFRLPRVAIARAGFAFSVADREESRISGR